MYDFGFGWFPGVDSGFPFSPGLGSRLATQGRKGLSKASLDICNPFYLLISGVILDGRGRGHSVLEHSTITFIK